MMAYFFEGKPKKYSCLLFENRKVFLTREQDKEFNDWINQKFDKKAV